MGEYFLGIDVGTSSVRAGLVSSSGQVLAQQTHNIKIRNPREDFYEQSSDDIWQAATAAARAAITSAAVDPLAVKGVGFDATCSLVVVGEEGSSVAVGDEKEFNIIMWMDHRAKAETEEINKTGHPVLECVGGQVSVEMQLPKLLWLKRHASDTWLRAAHFFDLPDWLTHRATGGATNARSLCSTVCKWNYWVPPSGQVVGWDADFFAAADLADLKEDTWSRIGGPTVQPPGSPVASGLSKTAAAELGGLAVGTAVGASLIDAHAGMLAMLAAGAGEPIEGRLGLVSGTSTCHLLLSGAPLAVPGVWGPYWSAIIEGFWLMEGGQSATGRLLDHVIHTHPAYPALQQLQAARGQPSLYATLEVVLFEMLEAADDLADVSQLAGSLHVLPDFHGNRSPLADPQLRGAVVGLSLVDDISSLAILYLATIQAISYGTRHIIQEMLARGHRIRSVTVCGGLTASPLYLQTQADVLGLPVLVPQEKQSMLLGASMLGMAAYRNRPLQEIIDSVESAAEPVQPSTNSTVREFHDKKFAVFLEMIQDQLKYRKIMESALASAQPALS